MDINIARLITQALSKNLALNQRTGVGEDDSVDKIQQKVAQTHRTPEQSFVRM